MLKKNITYIDYDGNERKDDFYFNLSKADLTEMEMSETGGLDKYIEKIVAAEDNREIYRLFKEIVLLAVGEKSVDGKTFIKKKMIDGHMVRVRDEFEQTEAFSELMMELLSSEVASANFISDVIPKELAEQMTEQINSGKLAAPSTAK